MITTDVELLEVFYAHTISPIAIAAAVSLIMTVFIGRFSPLAGILALAAYVTVGAVIPLVCGKRGGEKGPALAGTASGISTVLCWIPSGAWMRPFSTAGENREEKPWSGGRRIWAGCRKN